MHILTKLSLALLAGLLAAAAAADNHPPSPFLGNWSGVWPNGQHNEFNVVAVDADGQITAVYCALQPHGVYFGFDVEPGMIETTYKRKGRVLEFRRPDQKMRYRFTLSGADTLSFRYTRKNKHQTLEMARREPSGCAARIPPPETE